MATHYIALTHKEPNRGYGVSFPDVPGVTAVADTLDDALHEAGIALRVRGLAGNPPRSAIAGRIAEGRKLPRLVS